MAQLIVIFSYTGFMLIVALLCKFFPAKTINGVFGFRTKKSALAYFAGGHPLVILFTVFSFVVVLVTAAVMTNKQI